MSSDLLFNVISFYLFFFLCYVDPRYLHSFPTRRSSDLTPKRGCRVQVLVRDNNVDQALKALKKKMQREGIFDVVIADRKSTRLNSSHTVISYAVFCLKKKKKSKKENIEYRSRAHVR